MAAETQQFPIPREAISKEASQVRPGEVIATVVTAVFFSIGWIVGASWRGVVFCCLAIRYGYRSGAHVKVKPPVQEQERRTRPGPGGTRIIEELRERGALPLLIRLLLGAPPGFP